MEYILWPVGIVLGVLVLGPPLMYIWGAIEDWWERNF